MASPYPTVVPSTAPVRWFPRIWVGAGWGRWHGVSSWQQELLLWEQCQVAYDLLLNTTAVLLSSTGALEAGAVKNILFLHLPFSCP